jgi:hypothetical protein
VQNPDSRYKPFWEATIAVWKVEHALGREEMLKPWVDVDLAGPRPWYLSNWAMRVLRYEYGLPPTHPDDPPRRAMLGACRRTSRAADRRAPKTEAEWLAIPLDQCDSRDDEEGDSDAGSINDDVERGLPTSSHWDPLTKKSMTPRGAVPHPYPAVVQAELERNRIYEERIAQGGQEQGTSSCSDGDPTSRLAGGQATPGGRRVSPRHPRAGTMAPPSSHLGLPEEDVEMSSVGRLPVDAGHGQGSSTEPERDAVGEEDARLVDDEATSPAALANAITPPTALTNPTAPAAPTAQTAQTLASAVAPTVAASSAPTLTPGAAVNFGPPRRFVVPPPSAPTVRSGPRGGFQGSREQARGFTLEPQ